MKKDKSLDAATLEVRYFRLAKWTLYLGCGLVTYGTIDSFPYFKLAAIIGAILVGVGTWGTMKFSDALQNEINRQVMLAQDKASYAHDRIKKMQEPRRFSGEQTHLLREFFVTRVATYVENPGIELVIFAVQDAEAQGYALSLIRIMNECGLPHPNSATPRDAVYGGGEGHADDIVILLSNNPLQLKVFADLIQLLRSFDLQIGVGARDNLQQHQAALYVLKKPFEAE